MVMIETQIISSVAVFGGAVASGLAGFSFSAVAGSVVLQVLSPLFCLPATVGGNLTGQLLFRKIDDRRFRQLVLCFLLLAGGELLV